MKKVIKWIAIFVGTLILLFAATIAGFMFFVSPSKVKPFIIENVENYTDSSLKINGEMSWVFFPHLGVNIYNSELKNSEAKNLIFKAKIKQLSVSIDWLPLLQRNLTVLGFSVKDSELTFVNKKTGEFARLSNFNLQTGDVSLTDPFKVSASFDYDDADLKTKHKLDTIVLHDNNNKLFSFNNTNIISEIINIDHKFELNISSNFIFDIEENRFYSNNLSGSSRNLKMSGMLIIDKLDADPVMLGKVEITPFDLRDWLKSSNFDVADINKLKYATGKISYDGHRSLLLGKVIIDEASLKHLSFNNLQIPFALQNNVLSLRDIKSNFYRGEMQSDIDIRFHSPKNITSIKTKLSGFNVAALLKDLDPKMAISFSGNGNFAIQASAIGSNRQEILNSLNGGGNPAISNGYINGVDIKYLISTAGAMLNRKAMPTNNTQKTPFQSLNASYTIRDGVILNNDLFLRSSEFVSKGAGSVNLKDNYIDYSLNTNLSNQNGNLLNIPGLPIPIIIAGNLDNAKISLDIKELTKSFAEMQLGRAEGKLNEKIEKGKIPKRAGKFLRRLFGD